MSLPRDYEKELEALLVGFRAKCSELNLINSEMVEAEHERQKRYNDLKAYQDQYTDWYNDNIIARGQPLSEVRSELQAMQAQMLDILIEWMLRR